MSIFTDIMIDVSQSINDILGETCALHIKDPYDEEADLLLPSIEVIVDKGKQVKGEFNNLIGYRTTVKILRTDLAMPPRGVDGFIQLLDGTVYRLGEMTESTKTAFWLEAKLTHEDFPVVIAIAQPVARVTDSLVDISQSINDTYGELCALYVSDPYSEFAPYILYLVSVIIDVNKEIKGDFNNIIGYRTAIKILRSDLDMPPRGEQCFIQTSGGVVYQLGEMVESTNTAFWLESSITHSAFPTLVVGDVINIGELYATIELTNNLELHSL